MGFQREICLILCFSWSILVTFCVNLQTSTSKTQMLLLEKKIFHKYWLFCYRFITLTFDLCGLGFCILLVIRKQIPKTMKLLCWLIRAPDQIPDRFYVISMEFLLLRCRHLSWHNVLSGLATSRLQESTEGARNTQFVRFHQSDCCLLKSCSWDYWWKSKWWRDKKQHMFGVWWAFCNDAQIEFWIYVTEMISYSRVRPSPPRKEQD